MASSRKLIIGGIAAAGIVVLGVVLFLVFHHAPKGKCDVKVAFFRGRPENRFGIACVCLDPCKAMSDIA